MGYSFYAVLNTLPLIAAASLVPPFGICAVALLLKRSRPLYARGLLRASNGGGRGCSAVDDLVVIAGGLETSE